MLLNKALQELKENSAVTITLHSTRSVATSFVSYSITDYDIDDEEAIKLSEALQSNSSHH
jgi:hypothetical protein